MLNWDEIFFAQSWAQEPVAVCELVALVLESFEYLSFIGGSRLECDTGHVGSISTDSHPVIFIR